MTYQEIYKKVADLLQNTFLREFFAKKIPALMERAGEKADDIVKLGVIGVTSSGKSTLVNCIIGEKLLPMKGKPSSSQLVTCRKGRQKKAVICFDDTSFLGQKEETITGNAVTAKKLEQYCDESGNKQNNKHVNHIYLETDKFDFPANLQLIDSPGLDAYGLENHEKLTMATLLPTVDFCLFITTCKANSDAKAQSCINEFARHNKPVIIVQNMADSIKATPDGRKSVEDVAREHIARMRRIVDASSIADKNSVKIVQISALRALPYLSGETKDATEYNKSNYQELRRQVEDTVKDFMPRILNGKYDLLAHTINGIINDCKTEQQKLSNQKGNISKFPVQSVFPYEKVKSNLTNLKKEKTRDFMQYIGSKIEDVNRYINDCGDFAQKELNSVNNKIAKLVDYAANEIKTINELFSAKLDEFGIDKRNVFTELYIPQSVRLTSQTYTYKRPVTNWCGCVKYYEDVKRTDTSANRDAARNSVNAWYGAFGKTLQQLSSQIELVIAKIGEEVDRRREDFEQQKKAAEKMLKDQSNFQRNIDEFGKIINQLQTLKSCIVKADIAESKLDDRVGKAQEDVQTTITSDIFATNKLTKRIIQGIHRNTFLILQQKLGSDSNMVVGWDKNSMDEFVYNMFGDDIVKTVLDPPQDWRPQNVGNLFVMLNITQIGQAENQLARSGILKSQYRNMIIVAQDFREFAASLPEYLHYLKGGLAKTFGIRNCYYLFNDNNPLINMAAILSQTGDINTQSDEAEFIALVKRIYSAFASTQIINYVSQIIRTNK